MTIETAFERTFNNTVGSYAGYSIRSVIPASAINAPNDVPSFIRLYLSGVGLQVDKCYIGHKANGSSYAFAATPIQITKDTNTSFTINADNVVMDDAAFVWDGVSDIVVSAHITGGSLRRVWGAGAGSHFEKAGDYAIDLTPSGYSGSQYNPNTNTFVSKIDMDGYEEGTGNPDPDPEPTSEMFEIFGAIRNSGSGWFVIQDSGHEPMNIASLQDVGGGVLRLSFGKTAAKVGTLVITPDETYAQSGHVAGASVGLSYADIKFGQNGVAKNPSQVASASGNFWIYGKMWE